MNVFPDLPLFVGIACAAQAGIAISLQLDVDLVAKNFIGEIPVVSNKPLDPLRAGLFLIEKLFDLLRKKTDEGRVGIGVANELRNDFFGNDRLLQRGDLPPEG